MPVKRRKSKVRADDLEAWAMTFQAGRDYFDDLEDAGISTDDYGRPDRAEAHEAWRRLGVVFLETYRDPHLEPWALREFGPPHSRRRR